MSELAPGRTERDWWLAALAVLHSPRVVLTWLRDDSDEAAADRQEPVVALVLLAGIAALLSTAAAGRLLDEPETDVPAVAAWTFIGGVAYGFLAYWIGGLALVVASRVLGGRARARQVRHVLAYALAPLAASLVLVWPVRIALYGGDLFRRGGMDEGGADRLFDAAMVGAAAWTVGLVAVGLRAVNGWDWLRAAVATAATVAAGVALAERLGAFA